MYALHNIYVYIYMCIYIYMYIYMCVYIYMYIYVYIYIYMCIYICVCVRVHTYPETAGVCLCVSIVSPVAKLDQIVVSCTRRWIKESTAWDVDSVANTKVTSPGCESNVKGGQRETYWNKWQGTNHNSRPTWWCCYAARHRCSLDTIWGILQCHLWLLEGQEGFRSLPLKAHQPSFRGLTISQASTLVHILYLQVHIPFGCSYLCMFKGSYSSFVWVEDSF